MSHSGTALIDPYKIFEKIKLSSGMRVADFGCGRTGHFVFPSAQIVGEKGIVYAIDIMKNILESIRSMARSEGYDNVQTIWSDVELVGRTPIPEKSLDVCFFVNILFQMGDKESVIKEASRLLKKGGYLVVIDWRKKLGPLGPDFGKVTTADQIIDLANQVDLTLIENSVINDYHYLLILRKV